MPTRRIAVCLEVTPKQAFATTLDWPGWCPAGRDESIISSSVPVLTPAV